MERSAYGARCRSVRYGATAWLWYLLLSLVRHNEVPVLLRALGRVRSNPFARPSHTLALFAL